VEEFFHDWKLVMQGVIRFPADSGRSPGVDSKCETMASQSGADKCWFYNVVKSEAIEGIRFVEDSPE
jgi:hypothetical protein